MFDARAAKALKAGEHLTVDGAPGLRLIATETTRTWTYRYRSPVDSAIRQLKLGHWPALGLPGALVEWENARKRRAAGVDPSHQRKADRVAAVDLAARTGYSVGTVCADYLTDYRGTVVEKTWAELDRLFRNEIPSTLARLPAVELTRADAYDLLHPMRSRPVVAKRLRQGLGAAWDRALDAGKLPPETPNWWRLVLRGKLPSKGKKQGGVAVGAGKRKLSEPELAVLIPWLPNFSRDVDDVLTLYLWTACRGSEIVAMERNEISRERDGVWWTVPRAKLKMRRNPLTEDLRVPLVGRALAVVERRLLASRSSRWLFPSPGVKNGGHISQRAIGVATWSYMPYSTTRPEWVRPRLPVTHWAPHDLRRSSRTLLSALGCPENIGEAILGHLGDVYDRHGYDTERRVWLLRLSERLEALSLGG